MLPVRITVKVGSRSVPLEQISDSRIASAFRAAGQDLARRMETVRCPVHDKTATNLRVHFDERGGADLQYDSCCEKLGERIGEKLG